MVARRRVGQLDALANWRQSDAQLSVSRHGEQAAGDTAQGWRVRGAGAWLSRQSETAGAGRSCPLQRLRGCKGPARESGGRVLAHQSDPTDAIRPLARLHLIVAELAAEPEGLDELATEAQGDVLDGSRR